MDRDKILSDRYQKITILDKRTNEILAVIDDAKKDTPITTAKQDIIVKLTPIYD